MKKTIYSLVIIAVLCAPSLLRSQSNILIQSGASVEVQSVTDICADTRTIQGILTGAGTWCLIPLMPSVPQISSPSNNAIGQLLTLNLIWQKSFGAVTYRVQLSTDSLFSTTFVNDSTVTDSIRTVSGLNPLTYYWWRVNAKGIGGTSVYSVVYKFKTLGYPNQVALINPPNNAVNQPVSIQFRWSRASEQTSPFANADAIDLTKKEIANTNKTPNIFIDPAANIEAIGNYWYELVTDTVSMANLNRDTTLTDTTKSVGSLINNTNYYWRLKAKNLIGWGAFSSWWRFTTILAAPVAPVLVSPPNNATGQNLSLVLVWNKSSSAASYRVQVSTDSLFNTLIVNDSTLTDSLRTVSGLNPLTYYWWRVNAKNIGGTSSFSAVNKFKTLGNPNLVTLINPLNNAVNQPVSIQFRWNRAIEQTGPFEGSDKVKSSDNIKVTETDNLTDGIDAIGNYWFELVTDTVSMTNLNRDTTLTDTTKSVGSLINNINYYWRVKAKNQIGWGQFGSWWRFTTILAAPPPPVLVNPVNNSTGQNLSLTLLWHKSTTAATYRVQVATDSLFNTLIVNDSTLTDSLRTVSGLNPLTYYWWRVNAKNIGGTSVYSTAFKFKTLGNPNLVTLISPPNNALNQLISIQFRWSRATEQTGPFEGSDKLKKLKEQKSKQTDGQTESIDAISNYWYELVTDTVSLANLNRDTTLTDTAKTVSGLNYQTNYYWRVKAKNQIGWGTFSTWWQFTTMQQPAAIVSLKIIPGGFYNTSTGQLNMRDTVRVLLIDSATCTRIDSAKVVIDSVTFTASLSYTNAQTGTYFLYVYHRNHLVTSSRYEQNVIRGSTVSYDFTTDSTKAFGLNMIKVSASPVRWGMIPGDANRDGYIDGLDQNIWIAQNGLDGYLAADFNGDIYIDGLDQNIWIQGNGLSYELPCELTFEDPTSHLKKIQTIQNSEIEKMFSPKKK